MRKINIYVICLCDSKIYNFIIYAIRNKINYYLTCIKQRPNEICTDILANIANYLLNISAVAILHGGWLPDLATHYGCPKRDGWLEKEIIKSLIILVGPKCHTANFFFDTFS